MINIIIIAALINCKIIAITSASVTTEAVNKIKLTTEGPHHIKLSDKITTEVLLSQDNLPIETDSLVLAEKRLMDIFDLSTSGPTTESDEFNSVDIKNSKTGGKVSLGRRTNFRTIPNCPCVIRNRCAKSNSCLKEPRKK